MVSKSIAPDLVLKALLHEYNALYGLAEFRLNAMDRRIPIMGGLLTAFLGSVPVLPASSQILALVAVPISLIWLLRTTINHARSFEDALRHIELLEHRINKLLGQDAMGFQSRHPSKGSTVGGRTGWETVGAVVLASGLLLTMSGVMAISMYPTRPGVLVAFGLYILGIVGVLGRAVRVWQAYRYRCCSAAQSFKQDEKHLSAEL